MTKKQTNLSLPSLKKSCDGCTKCCEGYLSGEAYGKTFFPGKPCHFVIPGQGCSIYAKRPHDPCVTYQCKWRIDDDLPLWMKPSLIGSIIDERQTAKGVPYIKIHPAGDAKLDSRVLSWMINYALSNGKNLFWTVDGGPYYIGSPEFVQEMANPEV